jgi:hypothetical protein
VALLITGSVSRQILSGAALVTFLIGLVLTVSGIVLQLLELQHANRTINLESADVLNDRRKD